MAEQPETALDLFDPIDLRFDKEARPQVPTPPAQGPGKPAQPLPPPGLVKCRPHDLETCPDCQVDFASLNILYRVFKQIPQMEVPPPPQVIHPGRSQQITRLKEEGNGHYRQGRFGEAVKFYGMAASMAFSRPPWEASPLMREEASIALANRSAAYAGQKDFVNALIDAEAVVQLRRNWSKAHFRKGKALVGLGRFEDAIEAYTLGLDFESTNVELTAAVKEAETKLSESRV